jgi:hypothetical protein
MQAVEGQAAMWRSGAGRRELSLAMMEILMVALVQVMTTHLAGFEQQDRDCEPHVTIASTT